MNCGNECGFIAQLVEHAPVSFDLFCFDTGVKYANNDCLLAAISIHTLSQFPSISAEMPCTFFLT